MECDRLVSYPYVKVRLACRRCSREGSFRLARLADKYGAQIPMSDLLAYLAGDCKIWERKHAWQTRCGAYFIELDWPPKPPDLPFEGQRRMRVIAGGKR